MEQEYNYFLKEEHLKSLVIENKLKKKFGKRG